MRKHGTALTAGQRAEFVSAGTKALILVADRLDPDVAENWARNGQALEKVLLGALAPEMPPNTYPVSVDYDQKMVAAVAGGRYDWTNEGITEEHFPTTRSWKADLEIELVRFDRVISTENAIKEMEKQGLRPAELHELLALGAAHPDLQREFPIVALGSIWRNSSGNRSVPYLGRDGSERYLHLDRFEDDWQKGVPFAAVRN